MRKKIIQVPIPEDLLATLDRHSKEAGTSRAALIREACADYITRSEEDEADRRYVESYTKFPESHEEEDWSDWEEATP